MARSFGCSSSLSFCEEAAEELLEAKASALEAVVAGYFAAAVELPGVLLSPASLLLGRSAGAIRAFDARCRQPGFGIKRPRGFLKDEQVAEAALVSASRAPQILLIALAHDGRVRLSTVFRNALKRGSADSPRWTFLKRVAGIGARAFAEPNFLRPMLATAGPVQGGVLSAADFDLDPASVEAPAPLVARVGSGAVNYAAPWSVWCAGAEQAASESEVAVAPLPGKSVSPWKRGLGELDRHYIVAGDARSQIVALEFDVARQGVEIGDLGLIAPRLAQPVLRGVSRITPGTPIAFSSRAVQTCQEAGEALSVEVADADVRLVRDPGSRHVSLVSAG